MKKLVVVLFGMLIFISCTKDSLIDENLFVNQVELKTFRFLKGVDNSSIVNEVPPEILNLIYLDLKETDKLDEAKSLKNTYNFDKGTLTEQAKLKLESNLNKIENLGVSKVDYRTHISRIGWLPYIPATGSIFPITNSNYSGSIGSRLEAVQFWLATPYGLSNFRARAHVAGRGWLPYYDAGSIIGTTGQSRRMEAIQIISSISQYIYYRSYVHGIGWLPYVVNGQISGTTGQSRQMEAFELQIYN